MTRAVEPRRQRDGPGVVNRQHVRREYASGIHTAIEIDAIVVRLAVDAPAGLTVRECVQPRETSVGIQVPELRRLLE